MKTTYLTIIAIIGISVTIMSCPASFALGYGSIAKPTITSVPLRIFHLGVSVKDITCEGDLRLIIKAEDESPACVKPDTATKLVERGWATQMSGISFGGPTYVINDTHVSQMDNSVSALNLHMSTDSNVIKPGQSIGISISVNNTLGTSVDVTSQNNWSYPNVSTGPCFTIGYGVAILDGFYDVTNMTGGKILNSFNPGLLCPVVQETAKVYEFQPQSGNVKESQCKSIEGLQCRTDTYQMGQNYKFDGYWDAGMVKPFKSGMYTIIGADEWGHVAVEHFAVTNSTIFAGDLGHMSCPVMYGEVFGFDATIKNSTGFAHYYNSEQYGNTFFLHPGTQGVIRIQYAAAPANSSWFENNGNIPFNMTNGAALFYMANATLGKSTISYAMSLYSDETGNHSQICHYGIQYGGGFAEPCNTDNTGNIPPSELSVASKLLHPGVSTSFEPHSVVLYPGSSPEYTATISVNSDAMPGIYWLSLERSLCGPGVLAKLVVMP